MTRNQNAAKICQQKKKSLINKICWTIKSKVLFLVLDLLYPSKNINRYLDSKLAYESSVGQGVVR